MITLLVFYLHTIAAVTFFTKRWQEANWKEGVLAVAFLLLLKTPDLEPMLSVESYLDFFVMLCLAFGVLFQFPIAMHFLAKLGIVKGDFLSKNRRVSYLSIFILATIFNPVPEVFTQLLLAFAAIGLFELSILLVRWEIGSSQKNH